MFSQILTVTLITPIRASPDTTVKVEPQENTAEPGETFTIDITITDVQDLFGLEITLKWNASILQVTNVDVRLGVESHPNGVLHEPLYNETTLEGGKYQLIGTSIGSQTPSFNGSGNIARVTFNVVEAGSSALDAEAKLASKPLPGGVAELIPHTTVDGSFSTQKPEQSIGLSNTTLMAVILIVAAVTVIVIYLKKG